MSEQAQQGITSACLHPEAAGTRWSDPISADRQAELQAVLDAWEAPGANHGGRQGPFDPTGLSDEDYHRLQLTAADARWLADRVRTAYGWATWVPDLHLERANLWGAHLEGAALGAVHLEGAILSEAHLERTGLNGAHLEGAYLGRTHLEEGDLSEAHLEGADLSDAHLKRANLIRAHLERAILIRAHLERAALAAAHLERAVLALPHLEGASFRAAHLEGADLRYATLDGKTELAYVTLGEPRSTIARLLRCKPKWGNAHLGDIRWEGPPDLTQVRWESLQRLGDEEGIGWRTPAIGATGARDHRAVVRAYRQVAAQLRAQGLSEEADRFAERAQIRKRQQTFRQLLEDWRRPWRLPGDLLRWLFSWVLAGLAGYGYHPERSVFWYLATIVGFAFAYYQVTRGFVPFGLPTQSSLAPLTWYEAAILSVSSFHGRGFFQPLQSLGDPVAALASIEAVIGLFIEISFIATFTQRFFGSK